MRYLLLLAALALAGCQDRFRYPCQAPENWDQPFCKRPICSSTYTCPDQVVAPEARKTDEEVR